MTIHISTRFAALVTSVVVAGSLALAAGPVAGAATAAPTRSGTVTAFGFDGTGAVPAPAKLKNIVAVDAGNTHVLALTRAGTVTSWGSTTYDKTKVPAKLKNVVAVAGGGQHSLALKKDGTVVGWGRNLDGEATPPSGLKNVVAIAAGGNFSLALKKDGTVAAWGADVSGQVSGAAGLTGVKQIAAGLAFGVALKKDGTVVAWGSDGQGESPAPAGLTGVKAIAAGRTHALALLGNGTVRAWGWNDFGQAKVPGSLKNVVAIAAGADHSLAITSAGEVVAWGKNDWGQTKVPKLKGTPIGISGGDNFTVVLTAVCNPFSDVTGSNSHCADIEWLAAQGMSAGGKYYPTQKATRGQAMSYLYSVANPGKKAPKCTAKPFKDVPKTNAACGAIAWAKKAGVVSGKASSAFGINKTVTQGQMVTYLYRFAAPGTTPARCTAKPYQDVKTSSSVCPYYQWAKKSGITSGAKAKAGAALGRDVMATYLHRVHDHLQS